MYMYVYVRQLDALLFVFVVMQLLFVFVCSACTCRGMCNNKNSASLCRILRERRRRGLIRTHTPSPSVSPLPTPHSPLPTPHSPLPCCPSSRSAACALRLARPGKGSLFRARFSLPALCFWYGALGIALHQPRRARCSTQTRRSTRQSAPSASGHATSATLRRVCT